MTELLEFASGAVAALLSAVAMTRGMVSGRAALVIVAIYQLYLEQ
jgi:hypothetical protein